LTFHEFLVIIKEKENFMKIGKVLGILVGIIIYVGVAIGGVGQGYDLGVALCWPFGALLLALFGWAKLWTRK
jgi:hypothetical protein